MSDTSPTLADLEAAQSELTAQQARRDAYSGRNPVKYDTGVRLAFERVQALMRDLKVLGLLARTPHEALELRLDAAFPKARPKDIVTFEQERYRRRVEPATRNAAGQVSTWDRGWTRLEGTPARADGQPDFD